MLDTRMTCSLHIARRKRLCITGLSSLDNLAKRSLAFVAASNTHGYPLNCSTPSAAHLMARCDDLTLLSSSIYSASFFCFDKRKRLQERAFPQGIGSTRLNLDTAKATATKNLFCSQCRNTHNRYFCLRAPKRPTRTHHLVQNIGFYCCV
jgi:hypothetical protein